MHLSESLTALIADHIQDVGHVLVDNARKTCLDLLGHLEADRDDVQLTGISCVTGSVV